MNVFGGEDNSGGAKCWTGSDGSGGPDECGLDELHDIVGSDVLEEQHDLVGSNVWGD